MSNPRRYGANVILERGETVVLQLRDDLRLWGIFGGLIDEGEDPAAAAIREIGEELTVKLDPARLSPLKVFVGGDITTHLFRYPVWAELDGAVLTEGVRFEAHPWPCLRPEQVVPWHWHMLEWYWTDRRIAAGQLRVSVTKWESDGERLLAIRHAVFVEEQGVDPGIEADGRDPECIHAVAVDAEAGPVGTARLGRDGRVGRMAVLAGWRGRGVGASLLECLHDRAAAEGITRTYLHSQTRVTGFYARLGYVVEGGEFLEAEIPHVMMVRDLGG